MITKTKSVLVKRLKEYDVDKIASFLTRHYFKSDSQKSSLKGKKILLKPNLLGGYAPEKAVTTHPKVIEAVIKCLLPLECEILIGDSPGGSVKYSAVCKKAGVTEVAEKYDIEVVNFNKYPVKEITIDGYDIFYSSIFDEVDYIIDLAKYKTHGLMQFTGAVKNLYGFIPGLKKADYHRIYPNTTDFSLFVSKLYKFIKPKILFSVIDGIVGMEGKGPSGGKPRNFGLIMASEYSSALDYVASYLMGFESFSIDLVKHSMHVDGVLPSRIASNYLWQNSRFENVDIGVVKLRNKILNRLPKFSKFLLQKIFWYRPVITDNCKMCHVCFESCPVKAIYKDSTGKYVIDNKKCIRCLCCHEFCVHNAIEIKKSNIASRLIPT